ncbi:MAG: hypothetical protein HYX75_15165 [Acidobacteria bacterium]|nr:hypothetical protein [Acidobacteriota bacterium]
MSVMMMDATRQRLVAALIALAIMMAIVVPCASAMPPVFMNEVIDMAQDNQKVARILSELGSWHATVSSAIQTYQMMRRMTETLTSVVGSLDNLSLRVVPRIKLTSLLGLAFNNTEMQKFFELMEGGAKLSDLAELSGFMQNHFLTQYDTIFPDSYNPVSTDPETPPLRAKDWEFVWGWGTLNPTDAERGMLTAAEGRMAWRKMLAVRNQANLASMRGMAEDNTTALSALADKVREAEKSGKAYDAIIAQVGAMLGDVQLQTELITGQLEMLVQAGGEEVDHIGAVRNATPEAVEAICKDAGDGLNGSASLYFRLGW